MRIRIFVATFEVRVRIRKKIDIIIDFILFEGDPKSCARNAQIEDDPSRVFPPLFSLKLQNVMIGKEMEIKLIDFGITKMG